MRSLLLLTVAVLCAHLSNATNYYFSSVSGDDSRTSTQASDPSTPWRTISKLNSIASSLKPGDAIYFKRGEVFYGNLAPKSSGNSGSPISYGAYGTGANPLISGFTTVTGWTSYGNGIYYAPLTATNLQMVTINGVAKGMGRWPNTGYLKIDSHVGNSSITSSSMSGAPTSNFAGGEIVTRKYRFILDRHTITSQSGNTLNYSTSSLNGNNAAFSPVDKNGFFVQGHLATLDQAGEWYYDATNKRLYVHFGTSAPTSYTVKAATLDYNMFVSTVNYNTFSDLDFEGGNTKGVWVTSSTYINFNNCNFYNQGGSALYGVDVNNINVSGGTVNTSFSNGINFEHNSNNITVDGVSVSNTNMIPGTGRSGSGVSDGITVSGNGIKITNNRVINSGYNGINFFGNNVLVEKNYVDNFCNLKDDGGGIYTFNGPSNSAQSNRIIRNNIVLNAIGNKESAGAYYYEDFGKGAGIYLDEYVNGVQITGNTIANGDWAGIFMHNAHDCQISNNIIYNHRHQMHVSQYTVTTRNMTETNNQYIAKQAFQEVWYYRTFVGDSPSAMGTSNSNYFARPIDDNAVIHTDFFQPGGSGTSYIALNQWQGNYGLDGASKKSPVTFKANIADSIRFEYNASNSAKAVALDANYLDVAGNQYSGSVTLNPWTSVVLLKSKTAPAPKQSQTISFPAIPSKTYGDPAFALAATASSGLAVSYRVVSGPATVSSNTVTLTGTGTVTIEASQAGNTTYNAATAVNQSFTVGSSTTKTGQTITFPSIATKMYGEGPFALNGTASSGLPVSYRVVSGPATISGNTVTLTVAGTVTIEATQAGNATYNAAAPVQQTFQVIKANQSITFPAISNKTYGAAPFALTATANSGLSVAYRVVSGPATVSGNTVTLTGTGTVTIEASQGGDNNFNAATALQQSFSVTSSSTVSKQSQTITFGSLGYKTYGSAPFALSATASSGLPVSYRVVSGPATISGNMVTVTDVGYVYIEASQAGNATYAAATAVTRNFQVGKGGQTISFDALPNKVFGDAPFRLNATASSGLIVSYRVVSGPASVSGSTVTLTGTGTVTIEASQPGNAQYNAAYSPQRSFTVTASATTMQSTTATAVTETNTVVASKSTVGVYPNPVTSTASITVTVAQSTTAVLEVYDINGRLVQNLGQRQYTASVPTIVPLDASRMITGIYFVRLRSAEGTVSQKIQVNR